MPTPYDTFLLFISCIRYQNLYYGDPWEAPILFFLHFTFTSYGAPPYFNPFSTIAAVGSVFLLPFIISCTTGVFLLSPFFDIPPYNEYSVTLMILALRR